MLIEQRLLRKKFKDPLSPNEDGEFQLIYQSQLQAAAKQQTAGARGAGAGSTTGGASGIGSPLSSFQSTSGPIVGVVSKNTGASIRTYKGKQRYNEWQFTSMEMSNQAGVGGGGSGRGGDRGGSRSGDPTGEDRGQFRGGGGAGGGSNLPRPNPPTRGVPGLP